MREMKVSVKFKEGLHARPAVKMIKLAASFASDVTLEKNGKKIPADSIMSVLGACIVCGDEIMVRAEGSDEEEAIAAMEKYFA